MENNRTISRITGILFLVPFLAYGLGDYLISSLVAEPGYLSTLSAQAAQVYTGGLLLLINSLAVTGIGILIYPALKRENARVALLYASTRMIEAIVLLVGIASLMLLVNISAEYVSHPKDHLYNMGAIAIRFQYYSFQLAMVVLGIGSIFFCALLYHSGWLPKWVAAWGLVGYMLLLSGAVLEIFGLPYGVPCSIPGGLFEIFLGVWLLIKGVKTPVTTPVLH